MSEQTFWVGPEGSGPPGPIEILRPFLNFKEGDVIQPEDPMYNLVKMEVFTGRARDVQPPTEPVKNAPKAADKGG